MERRDDWKVDEGLLTSLFVGSYYIRAYTHRADLFKPKNRGFPRK